jgi:phosphoribosylformimino-5-aminoimidazole carboxamide ribotide isomerase
VNISATAAVAKASGIPVIASGGVRDLSDIEAIKKAASDGIEGVIVGKAIYTGSLSLADALRLLRGE